jgi:hypothetical protein
LASSYYTPIIGGTRLYWHDTIYNVRDLYVRDHLLSPQILSSGGEYFGIRSSQNALFQYEKHQVMWEFAIWQEYNTFKPTTHPVLRGGTAPRRRGVVFQGSRGSSAGRAGAGHRKQRLPSALRQSGVAGGTGHPEKLLPFSWQEIATVLESVAPLARIRKQDELFERHLLYGGYPEAWLSKRPDTILTDLLESFVMRDASDLHEIKRPYAFRTLLALAARQTGSLVLEVRSTQTLFL